MWTGDYYALTLKKSRCGKQCKLTSVHFQYYKGRQQKMLSPLDCLPAKAGGAVNGGAYAPFILTVDWLGWLCYEFRPYLLVLREFVDTLDYQIKTKSRYRFPFHFSSYQIVVLKSYLFHCHANDDKEDNLVVSILLG